MSETIVSAIVAGAFGFLIAAVPAYLSTKDKPTRRILDAAAIVDASGVVITTLREELARLDAELEEERKVASDQRRRIEKLERQLKDLGHTPVNGAH